MRNLILRGYEKVLHYQTIAGGSTRKIPFRNRKQHGKLLKERLEVAISNQQADGNHVSTPFGVYLSVEGVQSKKSDSFDYPLELNGLQDKRAGIKLLNYHETSNTATLFLPRSKGSKLKQKIEQYVNKTTKQGKPKNNALIANIEDFKAPTLTDFGYLGKPHESPQWYEVWFGTGDSRLSDQCNKFLEICNAYGIEVWKSNREKKSSLVFVTNCVMMVKVSFEQAKLLLNKFPYILEFRKAEKTDDFFFEQPLSEQKQWASEVVRGTVWQPNNVYVCVLDSGVSAGHPLLCQYILKSRQIIPRSGNLPASARRTCAVSRLSPTDDVPCLAADSIR